MSSFIWIVHQIKSKTPNKSSFYSSDIQDPLQTTSQYLIRQVETTVDEETLPGKLPETPLRTEPPSSYKVIVVFAIRFNYYYRPLKTGLEMRSIFAFFFFFCDFPRDEVHMAWWYSRRESCSNMQEIEATVINYHSLRE